MEGNVMAGQMSYFYNEVSVSCGTSFSRDTHTHACMHARTHRERNCGDVLLLLSGTASVHRKNTLMTPTVFNRVTFAVTVKTLLKFFFNFCLLTYSVSIHFIVTIYIAIAFGTSYLFSDFHASLEYGVFIMYIVFYYFISYLFLYFSCCNT